MTSREIETGTTELLARVEDAVAFVTLNRPARKNAMTETMNRALGRLLMELEVDDEVGCVVLTGAGGAFCGGGDVKGMVFATESKSSSTPFDVAVHRERVIQRTIAEAIWRMPKPTIAAVSGAAAGAGFSLALACDLRYAVSGAILTTAFAKVGLPGDLGGTWFLSRMVGTGKARELYYFSDRIDAEAAMSLGIVNAIFSRDSFEREVASRARRLAAGPRIAYRYMKENLNRAVHGGLGECVEMEVAHLFRAMMTEDHREAARAFVEKREPRFVGK